MQDIPRKVIFVVVALAIALAQTATCWSPLEQIISNPLFWGATITLCAAWAIYEGVRNQISRRLHRRIGVALAVLGSVGCWWGLLLFLLAGFNLMDGTSAEIIAQSRTQGRLVIAPSALIMISAVVSGWGTKRSLWLIAGTLLGAPLSVLPPCGLNPPFLFFFIAAATVGGFILDGREDEGGPPAPPATGQGSAGRFD